VIIAEAVMQAIYKRNVATDIGKPIKGPSIVYSDNQAAKAIMEGAKSYYALKHI
jgi:hypothetical protein